MADWYLGYLLQRNLFFTLGQETVAKSIGIGFPQGGVASAKFWLVAFNEAVEIINSCGIVGTAFADDCAVVYGGTNMGHMLRTLQIVIDRLTAWGRTKGLEFNSAKTVVVCFGRGRQEPPFTLDIDGSEVPYSKTVKYLGVTLDSQLKWDVHVMDKISKGKKLLNLVNSAVRNNWVPSPEFMVYGFTGVVRPMVTYAAVCWIHAVRSAKLRKEFLKFDRLGLFSIAQTAPSVPTRGMAVIYNVIPTMLLLKSVAMNSIARNPDMFRSRGANEYAAKGHKAICMQLAHEWGLDVHGECDRTSVILGERLFHVCKDSFGGQKKFLTPAQYNLFTDGSGLDGNTGSGAILYKQTNTVGEVSVRLPAGTTVFQAEVVAIGLGVKLLIDRWDELKPKYIKVFVDSRAALMALESRITKSKTVLATLDLLNELGRRGTRVKLCWVKAHVGTRGNERADALARLGSEQDAPAHEIPLPLVVIKNLIAERVCSEWEREWNTYQAARQTRQFFPFINVKETKHLLKLCLLYTSPSPRDRQKSRMPSSA